MPRKYYRRRRGYRKFGRGQTRVRHSPGTVKSTSVQIPGHMQTIASSGFKMFQGAAETYLSKAYPKAYQGFLMGKKALEMLNAEKKYFDETPGSVSAGAPSTAGEYVLNLFSGITVGDDASNRDGRQIRVKSIQIQCSVNQNATSVGSGALTRYRYILFMDNRPQIGTTPAYTDIFSGTNVSNTFYNLSDQWRRFRIIRNAEYHLAPGQVNVDFDINIPCSLPVRYDSSGNVVFNPVYLMLCSNETTNIPSTALSYRIRFYDN